MDFFSSETMNSIFDTINTKASDFRDSMKEQLNTLEVETNLRVSRIFDYEGGASDREKMLDKPARSITGRKQVREDTEPLRRYLAEENVGSSGEETDFQFGDSEDELPSYDELLPGYAQPKAYIKKEELCTRRITTTRKLTEADLDENNPLYRDRASVMRQDEVIESDEEGDNDVIKCILEHIERLKILLMEAMMD